MTVIRRQDKLVLWDCPASCGGGTGQIEISGDGKMFNAGRVGNNRKGGDPVNKYGDKIRELFLP